MLRSEAFEKSSDFGLELRNGIVWHGAIEIVDLPVFDPVAPGWKVSFEAMSMFGFLDRDDVVGGGKVGLSDGTRETTARIRCDAALFEAC